MIPRYIYNPERKAPAVITEEEMAQLRHLYNNPEPRPRNVRPLSVVEGDGLSEMRDFFLWKNRGR